MNTIYVLEADESGDGPLSFHSAWSTRELAEKAKEKVNCGHILTIEVDELKSRLNRPNVYKVCLYKDGTVTGGVEVLDFQNDTPPEYIPLSVADPEEEDDEAISETEMAIWTGKANGREDAIKKAQNRVKRELRERRKAKKDRQTLV